MNLGQGSSRGARQASADLWEKDKKTAGEWHLNRGAREKFSSQGERRLTICLDILQGSSKPQGTRFSPIERSYKCCCPHGAMR